MAARDHIGLADFSRSRQYIGALPGALATRVQRNCMRIKCMHAECEGTTHRVAFRSFCGPIMDLTVDAEISDGSLRETSRSPYLAAGGSSSHGRADSMND